MYQALMFTYGISKPWNSPARWMPKLKAIKHFVQDHVVKSEFKLGPFVSKTTNLVHLSPDHMLGKLQRPVEIEDSHTI